MYGVCVAYDSLFMQQIIVDSGLISVKYLPAINGGCSRSEEVHMSVCYYFLYLSLLTFFTFNRSDSLFHFLLGRKVDSEAKNVQNCCVIFFRQEEEEEESSHIYCAHLLIVILF